MLTKKKKQMKRETIRISCRRCCSSFYPSWSRAMDLFYIINGSTDANYRVDLSLFLPAYGG